MEGAVGIFDRTEVCFDLLHFPSGFASSVKCLNGCPWWFPVACSAVCPALADLSAPLPAKSSVLSYLYAQTFDQEDI